MKVSVDVDATPEELRRFLGLPELTPLNEDLVRTLRERMHEGTEGYDPFSLMAASAPAMETFQKMFWNAWGGARTDDGGNDEPSGRDE